MARPRRHTPEQIIRKLPEAEQLRVEVMSIPEVAKRLEISGLLPRADRPRQPDLGPGQHPHPLTTLQREEPVHDNSRRRRVMLQRVERHQPEPEHGVVRALEERTVGGDDRQPDQPDQPVQPVGERR